MRKFGFTLAEGATHSDMSDNIRRVAFTLAEVLITLAIIGVVAALTIPTLVININEKSWDSANKVFKNRFEETMRIMNVNQVIAGHSSTKDFVNVFAKNMKVGKICDSDELDLCFGEKFYLDGEEIETKNLTSSANLGLNDWNSEVIGLMFDSGVTALLTYDKNCIAQEPYSNSTASATKCVAMLYDVNGNTKPNTVEKDIKTFGNIKIAGVIIPPLPDEVSSFFGSGTFTWDDDTYTTFSGGVYNHCRWNNDTHTGFSCDGDWQCTKNDEIYWSCGSGSSSSGGVN